MDCITCLNVLPIILDIDTRSVGNAILVYKILKFRK